LLVQLAPAAGDARELAAVEGSGHDAGAVAKDPVETMMTRENDDEDRDELLAAFDASMQGLDEEELL
jgi:hypothetical protein